MWAVDNLSFGAVLLSVDKLHMCIEERERIINEGNLMTLSGGELLPCAVSVCNLCINLIMLINKSIRISVLICMQLFGRIFDWGKKTVFMFNISVNVNVKKSRK